MTQRQILEKRLDDLIREHHIKGRDTGSPCIICGKTLTPEKHYRRTLYETPSLSNEMEHPKRERAMLEM